MVGAASGGRETPAVALLTKEKGLDLVQYMAFSLEYPLGLDFGQRFGTTTASEAANAKCRLSCSSEG